MKSELQKQLFEKYPKFFDYLKEHDGLIIPMQFGIECGDGWYFILNRLMDSIYKYCEFQKIKIPQVRQIKEKFGHLCFYHNSGNDTIKGMVFLAQNISYYTCETCGTTKDVGHTTTHWIYTTCQNCYDNDTRKNKLPFIID